MSFAEAGKITLKEAGEKMCVSYRQAIRGEGVKGLIHGNRGRSPGNRISEEIREQILGLSQGDYQAFNDTHFTEQLKEREGIELSREAGIQPKRRRRPRKHRKRRERRPQEGIMVLWDGSPHPWFGREHPPCCLLASMDDATGKILAGRFFPFEGSEGYLWLLQKMVRTYGIPVSVYQDRHGALHRNDTYWSLEEQLAGRRDPTQVGLALEALGIHSIFALSPEAKGRIEQLFGTLQDRLGAELTLAGITDILAANAFLPAFINRFNGRFAVPPMEDQQAWRTVPKNLDLDRIISFRYMATVGKDNTVRLGGLVLDIPPGPGKRSYAKAKVEVRQLLDGSWRIYYQDRLIAKHPSTTLQKPIRALAKQRSPVKGAKSYDWIYQASSPYGRRSGRVIIFDQPGT